MEKFIMRKFKQVHRKEDTYYLTEWKQVEEIGHTLKLSLSHLQKLMSVTYLAGNETNKRAEMYNQ